MSPDAYIEHISLADLALGKTPPDIREAQTYLYGIQSDRVRKKPVKKFVLPVIVLEYTIKGQKETYRTIAPFASGSDGKEFMYLSEILNALAASPYTFNDIRTSTINVYPSPLKKFSDSDTAHIQRTIHAQMETWLHNTRPLGPAEDVGVQMRLIRYFIDRHLRDAAYLCVENAKHTLAVATENGSLPPETAKNLSTQLGILEDQLNKAMPFTFRF